jgi:hypothetical protein
MLDSAAPLVIAQEIFRPGFIVSGGRNRTKKHR